MSGARLLPVSLALAALLLAVLALGIPAAGGDGRAATGGARYVLRAGDPGATTLPAAGALRFAPGIAASDRQVVLDVVAGARPEARRLVGLVAGLVTISLGRPGDGVAGVTRSTPEGYEIELDLGGVYRAGGVRGIRRLVLHELAHVVDDAIVPDALGARLDAATPAGYGCEGGRSGGCAPRKERFAESFAKWAGGDIGDNLYLGYRVPPPRSLTGWGDPLGALRR